MSTSTQESDVDYVSVNTADIVAAFTCPICKDIYSEATTITECLHTFCRHCIYRKLSEAGARYCPVCNIDLGPAPLEKLKARDVCNAALDLLLFPKGDAVNGSTSAAAAIDPTQEVAPLPRPTPPEIVAPPASPAEPGVVTPSPTELNYETITNGIMSTETETSSVADSNFSSEGTMEVEYEEDEEEEGDEDSEVEFSSFSSDDKPQE